ncbi:hypothetical protein NDU88_000267 [Pleurodeles waltl]|uniref:Uncharacterized protein n=1 Tax=Pleurodeles waltl TaxID=8319 RepID=A0AAV7TF22_PLEWA|nr:hypothetical protein NDU88_000267 [Pleurodeles waltl]
MHGLARTTPPDFQRGNQRDACCENENSTHSLPERRAAGKQAEESTHRPRDIWYFVLERDFGGHSKLGGRREPPAKREPPEDRTAVKRPRRSFWVSCWAGRRPPKGRPPAQRETSFHEEAGSEWSRRSGRGATGAVAPVANFSVC